VATPLVFPYYGLAAIRNINARLLAAHVHAVARRCGFADYIALTTYPAAEGVLRRLKTLRRVYYCADDYATMPGLNASVVRDMEDRLLEIVDIVITTSRALYDLKRKQHPRVCYLPHGVDVDHFRRPAAEGEMRPEDLERLPRPILGF